MCTKSPKIPDTPPPPPPPEKKEVELNANAKKSKSAKVKAAGTRKLQIPLGGTKAGSGKGLGIPS